MIGKIKFICYEIDIHKHSVDIKIAKNCTWITVAEMRVLRTISRYWMAKINIRIAEVSTTLSYIDRWVVFLSLSFFLFSYNSLRVLCCSLCVPHSFSAKRKVVRRLSDCVECRHNKSNVRSCRFLTLSSLFEIQSFFWICLYTLVASSFIEKRDLTTCEYRQNEHIKYW